MIRILILSQGGETIDDRLLGKIIELTNRVKNLGFADDKGNYDKKDVDNEESK